MKIYIEWKKGNNKHPKLLLKIQEVSFAIFAANVSHHTNKRNINEVFQALIPPCSNKFCFQTPETQLIKLI